MSAARLRGVTARRCVVARGASRGGSLARPRGHEEGVFLTTIDGQGRRAAEVVRVSAPESTSVTGVGVPRTATNGPFPGDFHVLAATEGEVVVVVWRDLRSDAPGYYGRRYRCATLAE